MSENFEITHDAERQRFGARVDGSDCELDYDLQDGVMTITHTGVPSRVGGRGVAAAMTTRAFEWAKSQGLRIRPACSYAAVFAKRHPEYSGMIV